MCLINCSLLQTAHHDFFSGLTIEHCEQQKESGMLSLQTLLQNFLLPLIARDHLDLNHLLPHEQQLLYLWYPKPWKNEQLIKLPRNYCLQIFSRQLQYLNVYFPNANKPSNQPFWIFRHYSMMFWIWWYKQTTMLTSAQPCRGLLITYIITYILQWIIIYLFKVC